jgi:hypothetical protein
MFKEVTAHSVTETMEMLTQHGVLFRTSGSIAFVSVDENDVALGVTSNLAETEVRWDFCSEGESPSELRESVGGFNVNAKEIDATNTTSRGDKLGRVVHKILDGYAKGSRIGSLEALTRASKTVLCSIV